MDEISNNIIDRETALANFDHAREDFARVFSQVPDDALGFKPEGDVYSIGDLVPHVIDSLNMYTAVLSAIREGDWAEADPFEGEGMQAMREHAALMRAIYADGSGRRAIVEEVERAHDRLASILRELSRDELARRAPVHYPSGDDPFPTSAADILGWLTDHYNEHIAQIWQMVEQWEKRKKEK